MKILDQKLLKTVDVQLKERSYRIFIQPGSLRECEPLIKMAIKSTQIAILSTPRIYEIYGKILLKVLKKMEFKPQIILIADGEKYKNERSLLAILKILAKHGFQRDSCLISFGGGVIGDLGGLAASLYMRGINFLQFPTTFLSQVDASIGGKTAIDYYGIKNLIGSFYQPKAVIIDPALLKTLNEREFKTGLIEVIKYGIIQDETLFKDIEKDLGLILRRDHKVLTQLIYKSCKIKAGIVSEDEKEAGKRAWLNYGHTLGHALESYYKYEVLTHGEAVAYGIWFAAILSFRLGLCSKVVLKRQIELLKNIGVFKKLPNFNPSNIHKLMLLDKKARGGQIQFVLTRKIGLVTIQKNVPKSFIFSALNQLRAEACELR